MTAAAVGRWGVEARRPRGGRHGFLSGQGSAAFCGADHRRLLPGLDRVQQRFVEQDLQAPRVGSDVGLVAPFSVVIKFVAQFSTGNLDTISTSSSSGRHLPSCLRQSTEAFGRNSCGILRDVGHGS